MRLLSSLFVLPLIVLSMTAQARENHCDHNKGKVGGAIGGAVVGGVLGALLDHGRGGAIALGAGAGALGGGLLGDKSDDQKDFEECGTDSESYQRQEARDDRRADEDSYRADQRDREIQYDRAVSHQRFEARQRARYAPRYAPRYAGTYQCQDLGRGFGLVDLRMNEVVRIWGRDLRSCQYDEQRSNGY